MQKLKEGEWEWKTNQHIFQFHKNEADDLKYRGLAQIISSVEYMQNDYEILYKSTNPEIYCWCKWYKNMDTATTVYIYSAIAI